MSDENRYWSVQLIEYAFNTAGEAQEYQDKLIDALCAMPESEGVAATTTNFEGSSATKSPASAPRWSG